MTVRRALSTTTLLAAGIHTVIVTTPAFAQGPQPVPYNTAQVPYGQTPPPGSPGGTAPAPGTAPVKVGSDVIYLKGGGILRGTLIDAIPNAQARIQLATGEIATVPWQQIDKIEQSHGGPPSGPTPAPTTSGSAPAAPVPPSAVVPVHAEGPDGAELQQDATGHSDWKTVCSLPCDKQLPTGNHYRIMGEGIRASGEFTLHADSGQRDNLTVVGGSKGLFTLGVVGIVVGSALLPIGLLTALVGYSEKALYDPSIGNTNDGSGTITVGWTLALIGLAGGIAGLVLTINNSKTTVSQDAGPAGSSTGLIDPNAFKPTPTWRESGLVDRSAPPVLGVPLLSGSF